MIIERTKCKVCGTKYPADAKACPACGAARSLSSSRNKSRGSSQSKHEPYHLDSEALLAKINAIDLEYPTIQPGAPAPSPPPEPPPARSSLWLPFVAGFSVLAIGALSLHFYSGSPSSPTPAPLTATAPAETVVASVDPPAPAAGSVTAPAEEPPLEAATPAAADEEEQQARKEAARKAREERRRKALAAKQALEEKARLDQAERERLRAERQAAEARAAAAAAAAAAAKPASPQQLCAGEQNLFSRGVCESRVCSESQWRNHPYCIKRWQNELRKLSPGNIGG